ncbi:MAG TPA: sigma-70 family RNA polymerase sigma factor [Roseiflexaceae bacterium]|nr:sigma-70 family RNA polymerase sigma factor [Roseiflexaceae bacterium]
MARRPPDRTIQPLDDELLVDERTDAELLALVARREQRALAALYDRFGGRVFALALRLLGDRQAAEEVTQDVFLRIWQRAATFQPGTASVLAWLLAITRNRSIDELRSRRGAARRQETAELASAPADLAADPQRRAEDRLLAEDVRRMLATLPSRQRRALELSIFGGLSHSEISAALDTPLGTVKSWMRQGLRQLREALGTDWPADDA